MNMSVNGGWRNSSVINSLHPTDINLNKEARAALPENGNYLPKATTGHAATLGLEKPLLSNAELLLLINKIIEKIDNIRLSSSAENIKSTQLIKNKKAQDRLEKMDEQQDKINKAKKTGGISKILGWVTASLMTVAGAGLMVAGGSGSALLAMGVTMMVTMSVQETGAMDSLIKELSGGDNTVRAMITALFAATTIAVSIAAGPTGIVVGAQMFSMLMTPENLQAFGLSEKDAAITKIAISVSVMLVSLGAAKAAAAKSSTLFAGMPEKVQSVAKVMAYASMGFAGCSKVTSGGMDIKTAETVKEAEDISIDIIDAKKTRIRLQQILQDEKEYLKELLAIMQQRMDMIMDMLMQQDATIKQINANSINPV